MNPSPSHAVFELYLSTQLRHVYTKSPDENPNLLLKYDGESLGIPNNMNCPLYCSYCEGMFNNTIRCFECSNHFHMKNGECVPECGVHFYLDTDTNECFGRLIYLYIYRMRFNMH